MGILALQLINGVSSTVMRRSRSLVSVRVAMTAGTVQPKPMSIGTTLFPERPIRRRSLSITNATRAIYPVSSSMERKKNSTTMTGRNSTTFPTPPNSPSITSECTTGLMP